MPGSADRDMAGRQLGRYEVLTQLAAGGMAAVHIARAQGVAGFERLVAIKVLHPHLAYEEEFISMFLDEARLAARIRHPNVVATLDISDSQGDGYFLVMEYIEGNHLGAVLGASAKRGERLDPSFVCRVILEALQGLSAAHKLRDKNGTWLQLVHRDVSPHNILIGTDGVSRLTDFGVAKAEVRMASTRAGQFKGKLSYMAPEQASSGDADQRSDLFSMGVILWESLTGRRLFKGETNAATLAKILNEKIPLPSELWADLERYDQIVEKALSKDPEQRFQSAEEFGAALEQIVGRQGIATPKDVGLVVRNLCAEKLEQESKRISSAIRSLGQPELQKSGVPRPNQAAPNPSPLGTRRPVASSPVRPPSVYASRENRALKFLVVMLLALVIAGGSLLYSRWRPIDQTNGASNVQNTLPKNEPEIPPPPPLSPKARVEPTPPDTGEKDIDPPSIEPGSSAQPSTSTGDRHGKKARHVRRPTTKRTSGSKKASNSASNQKNTETDKSKPPDTEIDKSKPPDTEIELDNPYRQ